MYRSKHNPLKPIKYSTLKENAPNMGKKDFFVSDPKKFLRASTPSKRNPLKPIANINKFSRNAPVGKKAPVPSKDERPVIGLHTEKNFITANAIEAILTVPQAPQVKGGEIGRGAKRRTDNTIDIGRLLPNHCNNSHPSSQLFSRFASLIAAPDYLNKEDYGKVPTYLSKVKDEIKAENELIDQFVAQQMMSYEDAPELCDEMDEEERLVLIEKLKTKWDAVNKKYQVLCMHTMFEGHSKIKKENFEKEMNEIEGDLQKLTSNGPLLISHA